MSRTKRCQSFRDGEREREGRGKDVVLSFSMSLFQFFSLLCQHAHTPLPRWNINDGKFVFLQFLYLPAHLSLLLSNCLSTVNSQVAQFLSRTKQSIQFFVFQFLSKQVFFPYSFPSSSYPSFR